MVNLCGAGEVSGVRGEGDGSFVFCEGCEFVPEEDEGEFGGGGRSGDRRVGGRRHGLRLEEGLDVHTGMSEETEGVDGGESIKNKDRRETRKLVLGDPILNFIASPARI